MERYVLFVKHQTCTQNLKISPEKQQGDVNNFQREGKSDTCYHEILTEVNVFKKGLLFHIASWNFLSIFQQKLPAMAMPCSSSHAEVGMAW